MKLSGWCRKDMCHKADSVVGALVSWFGLLVWAQDSFFFIPPCRRMLPKLMSSHALSAILTWIRPYKKDEFVALPLQ